MYKLRDYQVNLSSKANDILTKYKIVYLAMEVRTGKTLTALKTAELYGAQKVLFLTKKKAISGIYEDYLNFKFDFIYGKFNFKVYFFHFVESLISLLSFALSGNGLSLPISPKPIVAVNLSRLAFAQKLNW